jgi:hypothetical protein
MGFFGALCAHPNALIQGYTGSFTKYAYSGIGTVQLIQQSVQFFGSFFSQFFHAFFLTTKIKKINKNFAIMKNSSTFAAHNILKGGCVRQFEAGFFYAPQQNIDGVTPVWNCNRTTALEVLCNGSVTPFFCYPTNNNF